MEGGLSCKSERAQEIWEIHPKYKRMPEKNLKFGQLSSINGVFVGDHQCC